MHHPAGSGRSPRPPGSRLYFHFHSFANNERTHSYTIRQCPVMVSSFSGGPLRQDSTALWDLTCRFMGWVRPRRVCAILCIFPAHALTFTVTIYLYQPPKQTQACCHFCIPCAFVGCLTCSMLSLRCLTTLPHSSIADLPRTVYLCQQPSVMPHSTCPRHLFTVTDQRKLNVSRSSVSFCVCFVHFIFKSSVITLYLNLSLRLGVENFSCCMF
jgi:hypothetical protein